jgi:RNA polymerase sigma-70 factor (ECF subfamily)
MGEPPATRPSLLLRLRDPEDQEAWRQFVDLYAPLIYQFGRKRGLQDADAADLTQVVLQALTQCLPGLSYDPRQGTFRGWLFAVVRNQLHKLLAQQRRLLQGTGATGTQDLLEQQPAREDLEAVLWEQEYERQLFVWAADQVRGHFEDASWQAFWRTAVEGQSAREAAQGLGMTLGAIYTAKSRVLDRIRKVIQRFQLEEGSLEERDHGPRGGLS